MMTNRLFLIGLLWCPGLMGQLLQPSDWSADFIGVGLSNSEDRTLSNLAGNSLRLNYQFANFHTETTSQNLTLRKSVQYRLLSGSYGRDKWLLYGTSLYKDKTLLEEPYSVTELGLARRFNQNWNAGMSLTRVLDEGTPASYSLNAQVGFQESIHDGDAWTSVVRTALYYRNAQLWSDGLDVNLIGGTASLRFQGAVDVAAKKEWRQLRVLQGSVFLAAGRQLEALKLTKSTEQNPNGETFHYSVYDIGTGGQAMVMEILALRIGYHGFLPVW